MGWRLGSLVAYVAELLGRRPVPEAQSEQRVSLLSEGSRTIEFLRPMTYAAVGSAVVRAFAKGDRADFPTEEARRLVASGYARMVPWHEQGGVAKAFSVATQEGGVLKDLPS